MGHISRAEGEMGGRRVTQWGGGEIMMHMRDPAALLQPLSPHLLYRSFRLSTVYVMSL